MVKILLSLFFIGGFYGVYAQDEEDLSLIRVECWSPVEGIDNWVRIKEDGLSNIEISGASKTKVWMVDNDGIVFKKPAAYVSGSTPRIGACFRQIGSNNFCTGSNGSPTTVDYFVRGEALDQNDQPLGMLLPAKQLVKTGSKKTYEYLAESTNNAFTAEEVRYFEEFKVKWQWSKDLNGPWNDAGTSDNRLYVTHKLPISIDDLSKPFFYTSLHLGCTLANAKNVEADIFESIYAKFESKCIKRVDDAENNCLKFWGNAILTGQNRGLEYLLQNADGNGAYEDGRCGDWVELLKSIIYIQGITGVSITALAYNPAGSAIGAFDDDLEDTYLQNVESFFGNALFPTPNDPDNPTNVLLDNGSPGQNLPGSGARLVLHGTKAAPNIPGGVQELVIFSQFFVKSWNFSSGENKFYAAIPDGANLNIQNPDGTIVQTLVGADIDGESAQGGVMNPRSYFGDHVLYQYNDLYYDPSYGKGPMNDKTTWATESLSGYGTLLTYIAPNLTPFTILWLNQEATASNSSTIKFVPN